MNIFNFRQNKLGMTLVEMVVSLVILGILMTSTMGMVISSSNIFISTSKAALDKQVGNSTFDILQKMIMYTTHLEITNEPSDSLDQGFSINIKDEDNQSGYLYYKREKAESAVAMYDNSFYGNRTIQYQLTPVGKDGKHVDLKVTVFREGKAVYVREQVIRCVNLALVGGANGNAVYKSADAPTINPYISFSVDEMLFAGGKSAWTIEYKVNSYLAKYNAILKDYYNHLLTAVNPVNNLYDQYKNQGKNSHLRKAVLENAVQNRNKAIYGETLDSDISKAVNLSSNGTLPAGVKWDKGSDPSQWNNIRAYYQKQIYDLLNFTPSTIQDENDVYYGVIASKEELYTGFLLTYYSDKDEHKKVTKDSFPSFEDPSDFFGGTNIEKYAVPSSSNGQDKMVILAYFVDDSNDFSTTGNILRPSTYKDPYYKKETKTGANQLMVTTGLGDEIGKGASTRIANNGLKVYGTGLNMAGRVDDYKIQENYNETVIDISKKYVAKTGFTLNNLGASVKNTATSKTEYFTDLNDDEFYGTTHYYPKHSTTVTKTTATASYDKFTLTELGNLITVNSEKDSCSIDLYDATSVTYYDYKNGERTHYGLGKTSSIWDKSGHTYGLITETKPEQKTITFTSGAFSKAQENDYNSWNLKSLELKDKLKARPITDVADQTSTKTVYTSTRDNGTDPESCTRIVFKPKTSVNNGNIKEGWYYYVEKEDKENGKQAYYFFYLSAKSFTAEIGDPNDPNTSYDPNYVVNKDKIAVTASSMRDDESGSEIQLFSKNWELKYVSYDRADYVATDEGTGKTVKVDVDYYTVLCHQYTDWFIYTVDWNTWYGKSAQTGIINKLVNVITRIFAGDKTIKEISPSNSKYSLGCYGQISATALDTDLRSFNMAWAVYNPQKGTWYYIPPESSRLSTTLSKIKNYDFKDTATPLDLTSWASSTALQYDIGQRQIAKSGLLGIDQTSDVPWTSLPGNTEKAS